MTEDDYLDPDAMYNMAEELCQKIINDNYILENIKKTLISFCQTESLQGETYKSVRQQFQDYCSIFDKIIETNNLDINALYAVGNEVSTVSEILSGKTIFQIIREEEDTKAENEANARANEQLAEDAFWIWDKWHYKAMANYFLDLADKNQKTIDEEEAKKDLFDAVNTATKSYFSHSSERQYQITALTEIIKAFNGVTYDIAYDSSWHKALDTKKKTEWDEGVEDALLEYGLSEEEISRLKNEGVVLTLEDVETLKSTKGTQNSVLSSNNSAIFYAGKVYFIEQPAEGESYDLPWEDVAYKKKVYRNFDIISAITGMDAEYVEGEDVKDSSNNTVQSASDIYASENMEYAAYGSAGMLAMSFFVSGYSQQECTITFQTNGVSNRAVITVGNSSAREKFSTMDYNSTINTYQDQETVSQMRQASAQAGSIYTARTGTTADPDKNYTIISKFDERHQDDNNYGTLYYNSDGGLMLKPYIYSGDSVKIATCNSITGDNTKVVYDMTEDLSDPIYANGAQSLVDGALASNANW